MSVPSNAQTGTYTGNVTITPAGGTPATVQLQLTVPNLTLGDGPTWSVYYYSASPGNANIDRDFTDMRNHGVNSLLYCPPAGDPPFTLNSGPRYYG